jgi:hypothetical protein
MTSYKERKLILQILGHLLQLFVLHHPPKLVDFVPYFYLPFSAPCSALGRKKDISIEEKLVLCCGCRR